MCDVAEVLDIWLEHEQTAQAGLRMDYSASSTGSSEALLIFKTTQETRGQR